MAHFAQLDENNKVIRVIVIQNEFMLDENDNEVEELGIQRCKEITDPNGRWIQTSYNNNFRGKFASIDGYYIEDLDIFTFPKPHDTWILDSETLEWNPPVEKPPGIPGNGQNYVWDDNSVNWIAHPPIPMPDDAPEGSHYVWNELYSIWELIED